MWSDWKYGGVWAEGIVRVCSLAQLSTASSVSRTVSHQVALERRKGEFVVENTGKIDSVPFLLFPVAAKQFRPAKIGPSRSTDESRTRPVDF